MEHDPKADKGRGSKGRPLLTFLLLSPLVLFGVAVAAVNLYLLGTELVKLFTW